jgi:cobalt-zinc-cadmium efflux system outer membrane protein
MFSHNPLLPFLRFMRIFLSLLFASAASVQAPIAQATEQLSLAQAQAMALASNPDLRMATLNLASAGAAITIAAAHPNTTLTMQTMGINPALGIGSGSLRSKSADSTLRIDQLFERGGKRGFRIDMATQLEAAAKSGQQETRRQLRLLVSQAYYFLRAARDKLDITRQSVTLFDQSLRAAQRRRQAGDLAPADVARIQVDALHSQNDVTQAQSDLFLARQNLLLLIGRAGQASELNASDDWPTNLPAALPPGTPLYSSSSSSLALQAPTIDGPDTAALLRRPDVLAAQSRLAGALAARQLALAARSADLTLGLQAEHFPASRSNAQGSGNSYGVALQIPLFVRYAFDGEIRSAELAVDIAQHNLDQTLALARSDALQSMDRLRAAFERMQRSDDSLLVAAKKSADAAEFAFAKGALGIMDLLDVRRTYRSAQLEALTARVDFAIALAAWQAAISESNLQ